MYYAKESKTFAVRLLDVVSDHMLSGGGGRRTSFCGHFLECECFYMKPNMAFKFYYPFGIVYNSLCVCDSLFLLYSRYNLFGFDFQASDHLDTQTQFGWRAQLLHLVKSAYPSQSTAEKVGGSILHQMS